MRKEIINNGKRGILIRRSLIVVLCTLTLTASMCKVDLNAGRFVKALRDAGWTYVDFPRQLLGAGTIVAIDKKHGIAYRSRLSSCVSDPEVLKTVQGATGLNGKITTSYELGIDALAQYNTIAIGPEFSNLKNMTLTLGSTTEEALDSLKVGEWLRTNLQSLSPGCRDALLGGAGEGSTAKENIFVLTDVLKVTGYRYTFHDTTGAKVKLSPANLSKYFSLGTNVKYSVTDDGDLSVDSPVFIAFKAYVSPFASSFGATAPTSPMQILDEMNSERYPVK